VSAFFSFRHTKLMSYSPKEQSTNRLNQVILAQDCVLSATMERLSARWKLQILYAIRQGQRQFSLLKQRYPSLSENILGKRLRELEREKLVCRQPNPDYVPPQVHYTVTSKGLALLELMEAICDWELKFTS